MCMLSQFRIKFTSKDYLQIYKFTKHYNYLHTFFHLIQTDLQASKLLKHICTDTKLLKMPKLGLS
jgi:hypothetical protein